MSDKAKLIRTKLLDVSVRDNGPEDGAVVLLLHGWPDDATTWSSVAPYLHVAGMRTIAPMLRGFGETRFRAKATPRTGDAGILAHDAIDLMDALGVEQFVVAGHDWGASVAEALAVGWPDRVQRIAMLSTPSRLGGLPTPTFEQAKRYWYHWFQATKRGSRMVASDPKGFARIMWDDWSPPGWYDDDTFSAVARSFENPDWVAITLHSYRSRWEEAAPDRRSAALERKIKATKRIDTPTVFFQGGADGVSSPDASKTMAAKFSGPYRRVLLEDVGHFPTREAPDRVGAELVDHFS